MLALVRMELHSPLRFPVGKPVHIYLQDDLVFLVVNLTIDDKVSANNLQGLLRTDGRLLIKIKNIKGPITFL